MVKKVTPLPPPHPLQTVCEVFIPMVLEDVFKSTDYMWKGLRDPPEEPVGWNTSASSTFNVSNTIAIAEENNKKQQQPSIDNLDLSMHKQQQHQLKGKASNKSSNSR